MEDIILIFTTILAVYSTVISTITAVANWKKDRRSIRLFLEHVSFNEIVKLRISNIGYRPVTITKIEVEVCIDPETGILEQVPLTSVFHTDDEAILPATIKDGDVVEIMFSDFVSGYMIGNKLNANIVVYDGYGKAHRKYEKLSYNPKWNRYEDVPKAWKKRKP